MEFYLILQEIMNEKNFSIPDVARKCNLSDGTVRSVIARKQKNVSLEVAFKLSDGLGVSLERLNGMSENVQIPIDLESSQNHINADQVVLENLLASIYGSDAQKALSLYVQLDQDDRGEIRGEMKHMLKDDKYKTSPCSGGKGAIAS